jgi:hypothetical protein
MYIQEMLHENSILTRKQNDGKALAELDSKLRELDPNDPVKYDFALFGLGVFEGFSNFSTYIIFFEYKMLSPTTFYIVAISKFVYLLFCSLILIF